MALTFKQRVTRIAAALDDTVRAEQGLGFVASVAGSLAGVRKGSRTAPATANFFVPPHIAVLPGDEVFYFQRGATRVIERVLSRDAVVHPEADEDAGEADPATSVVRFFTPNIFAAGDGQTPARDTDDAQLDLLFAADDAQLQRLLDKVDVYLFFGSQIQRGDADYDAVLARAFPLLDKYGVELGLEVGGPLGHQTGVVSSSDTGGENGRKSAVFDLANVIAPVEALGGTVKWLTLDGALRRTIDNGIHSSNGLNFTIEESCAEVVRYMQEIHFSRPDIRFVLLEDAILWPYDGVAGYASATYPANQRPDLKDTLAELFEQLEAAHILDLLQGFHADNSVEYSDTLVTSINRDAADWYARIFAIQAQCEDAGVDFGQMYNSLWGGAPGQDGNHAAPAASDEAYQANILRHIETIEAYRRQSRPDVVPWRHFVLDAFYYHPRVVTPPSSPFSTEATYMRAVALYESYGDDMARHATAAAVDALGHPGHAVGRTPFAYPPGVGHASVQDGTISLTAVSAGNGGARAWPVYVGAAMMLEQLRIWNIDTANARTAEWGLYRDRDLNDNRLRQVASGSFSFTPTVASARTSQPTGYPIRLEPGWYWLVIRNTSASQTFGLSTVASGTMSANVGRSSSVAALSDKIDISGWSGVTVAPLLRLEGRSGNEAAAL